MLEDRDYFRQLVRLLRSPFVIFISPFFVFFLFYLILSIILLIPYIHDSFRCACTSYVITHIYIYTYMYLYV